MTILGSEVNRFLGNALLDPSLLTSFFSGERSQALQNFNLQPSERKAILTSKAGTLVELSRDLTTTCGLKDTFAETNAVIDQFYQSIHMGARQAPIRMDLVAQRILNSLPGQPVAEGVAAVDKFIEFQAAS